MLTLNLLAAREHTRDLRPRARDAAIVAQAGAARNSTPVTRVTLRYAGAADAVRLRHLAELDSAQTPSGPALVAEVDGRLRAALPLDGSAPIADPFHRGAELIELLRVRAAQLGCTARPRTAGSAS